MLQITKAWHEYSGIDNNKEVASEPVKAWHLPHQSRRNAPQPGIET
jgi:hypothetical protein